MPGLRIFLVVRIIHSLTVNLYEHEGFCRSVRGFDLALLNL